MQVKNLMKVAGSVMLSSFLLMSCSKSDDAVTIPAAGMMAFNLSTDQDAVGVSLSGNILPGTPLQYTSYTGGYLRIYPGTRSVNAYDYFTGKRITSTASDFESSKYYSLFVVGAKENYRNLVVKDNFDSLSTSFGESYIRYVNAIPDSSALQVTISGKTKQAIGGGAAFATVSDFVSVTPGEVTITIRNGNNIEASRTIKIDERKAYTLLFVGDPEVKDSSKKVEIRYIENGTLSDSEKQRTLTSSNAKSSK